SRRLGPWLYGVAWRTASRLRRAPRPLRLAAEPVQAQPPCPVDQAEEFVALHQEISRLPEKYRQPIVLCYPEGLTHDAAAARLAWPVGTVRGRLARARDRLRKSLTARGVCLSAGFLDIVEQAGLRHAALPLARTQSIVQLLEHCASSRVVFLAQGALAAMLTEKLKWLAVAVVAPSLVLAAAGTALIAGSRHGKPENGPALTVEIEPGQKPKTVAKKAPDVEKPEGETEAKADSLESDKVKAELLEMETEALHGILQNLMRILLSRADSNGMMGGPLADPKTREYNEHFLAFRRTEAEVLRKTYLEKRLELAKLKRAIARQSKELGQSESEKPSLVEISQRLKALEIKIDRIQAAVSKNPR
ncbi:MAG: RNA polymerase sigma factor, partial [Isosphaeraceae bacterium]